MSYEVHHGDCLEVMKSLPDNSVDAVVTDPPYGLSFMGKRWDYDVPSVEIWQEVLRVLKPGGHLLSFGGTRTYHRMVVNIEDAGFEIRDQIQWIYGSGFPKSLNVGNGFGTALKPANEPICLARKPLIGTVAENVKTHGTGAINIDGCRVDAERRPLRINNGEPDGNGFGNKGSGIAQGLTALGRFPANVIHDGSDEVVGLFPQSKSTGGTASLGAFRNGDVYGKGRDERELRDPGFGDSGSAARFFKACPPDPINIDPLPQKRDIMSVWKSSYASTAESLLNAIRATTRSSALTSAGDSERLSNDPLVSDAVNRAAQCEILTALILVEIRNWDSKNEALQAIRDSIGNCNGCSLLLNLALSAASPENTDITQITTSLLRSFGSALDATDENTNQESPKQIGSGESRRFIYVPKASKADRNAGLEGVASDAKLQFTAKGGLKCLNCDKWKSSGNPCLCVTPNFEQQQWKGEANKNNHPTVKPTELMRYLCRLITPPNGTVLDPFAGSGSTGKAAILEGFSFIGIEREKEYAEIARARIAHVSGGLFV